MVESNKILTVSYGTFSCTLEGFEDNFETMKRVAEYFRDLAADDRYFGAEPPVPDAEMLARIAEKEIARRVEARLDEQGILLRAAPVPEASEVVGGQDATIAMAEPTGVMFGEELNAKTNRPKAETDSMVNAERISQVDDTDVADTAVVLETYDVAEDETPVSTKASEALSYLSDETSESLDTGAAPDVSGPIERDEAVTQAVSGSFDWSTGSQAVEPVEVQSRDDDVYMPEITSAHQRENTEHSGAVAHEDSDGIADKLARIRAVVSGQIEPSQTYLEDQHAEEALASATLRPASPATLPAFEAECATEDAYLDQYEEGPVAYNVASFVSEPDGGAAGGNHPASDAEPFVLDTDQRVLDAEWSLSEDADLLASEDPESGSPARFDWACEPEDQSASAEWAGAETDERGLDENVFLHSAAETDEHRAADTSEGARKSHGVLPPQLARSIKALTRRDRLTENGAGEETQDLSRLMAEADAQMDEPEGRNRRSAIAHLRAAVAATKEDRKDGDVVDPVREREAQFREDLDMVRPRLTDGDVKRTAPLKLVAEQRIDLETDDGERGPTVAELQQTGTMFSVRPRRIAPRRRISDAEDLEGEQTSGFMTYAETSGASRLPELLEAAAAYLTLVEKRPQFSRPQLMNKVREVPDLVFTREDRLRSFGQLLREGKIEKTSAGRFKASELIGFRPDERAAG